MTDKEKTIKELKEVLDSLDITNEYRLNLIKAVEYLQEEPVSEDLNTAAKEYANNITEKIGYRLQLRRAVVYGAKWQKEQMMTKLIEAVVSQVPCSNEIILYNPSSVDKYYLPQEMNKLGLNKGDKVKIIIIKEDLL